MEEQVSVISSDYCLPESQTLQINTDTGEAYNDIYELVFSLTRNETTNRRVMRDNRQAIDILTLKRMTLSFQGSWNVFEGHTTDSSKLLFTVKLSSIFRNGKMSKLEVSLKNTERRLYDYFKVIIVGNKNSCTVYAGQSPKSIATMVDNMGFMKVKINPNVDSAFIVAILRIINLMDFQNWVDKIVKGVMKSFEFYVERKDCD